MNYQIEKLDHFILSRIQNTAIEAKLKDAFIYAMFPGGKRIRPKIVFMVSELLRVSPTLLYPAASAIEILHAASLIHDDLPALDNDDYRRGRLSVHKQFGESTAILTADYMIGYALQLASESTPSEIDNYRALIAELTSTWCKIQEGQMLDLGAGSERQADSLVIYEKKTAALFETSFVATAFFSPQYPELAPTLRSLGKHFGLLFQVLDDIIDAREEKGRGGASSDAKNNKNTILQRSDTSQLMALVERLGATALGALTTIEEMVSNTSSPLREMIQSALLKAR